MALYKQELSLLEKINKLNAIDQLYLSLSAELKREKDLYSSAGKNIIDNVIEKSVVKTLLEIIAVNEDQLSFSNGKLEWHLTEDKEKKIETLSQHITKALDSHIANLEKEKGDLESQFSSAKLSEELPKTSGDLKTFKKLREDWIANSNEARRSRQKLIALVQLSQG